MTLDEDDIATATRNLGLAGLPLVVHSSFRAFGGTVRSPEVVIQGLLNAGCSVLTPTFTYDLEVAPPVPAPLQRNGLTGDERWIAHQQQFDPAHNALSQSAMGAIPAALLAHPDRQRSNHPLNSFAAVGPLATELLRHQTALDVYAPLRVLCEHAGQILLLGVDFTTMTLLHLAESQAGRALFGRWVHTTTGPAMCLVGGCPNGFGAFRKILAPIEQRHVLGAAIWRILPAREALHRATAAVRADPTLTHCSDTNCIRCMDAIAGGPLTADPPGP